MFALAGKSGHNLAILIGDDDIQSGNELSQFQVDSSVASEGIPQVGTSLVVFIGNGGLAELIDSGHLCASIAQITNTPKRMVISVLIRSSSRESEQGSTEDHTSPHH